MAQDKKGFYLLGAVDKPCKKCGSLIGSKWKSWKKIIYNCNACGNSYFIPCSEKRISTRLNKWSLAVRERDGFMCRKCGSREKLNAHHIKSFADFPGLRFNINNGITLCEDCHKKEHKK